jgi:hypothetical protein
LTATAMSALMVGGNVKSALMVDGNRNECVDG